MFEHLDELPVRHHRLIISSREHRLLLFESRTLIEWIIELGVSISYLTASEYHLESLDRTRILRARLRERGDELRMSHEKCGARNLTTSVFPEGIGEALTIGPVVLHTELRELRSHGIIGRSQDIDTRLLEYSAHIVYASPLICEVECMPTSRKSRLAIDCLCDSPIHLLHEIHPIFVVRICPVELHIRELLEVIWTGSFISKCATDLERLRKSACHETLLPELTDRDAQVDIDIVVVMVCGKWPSLSSTRRMLECRSIYLEESFCYEELSRRSPKCTLSYEHRTELIVGRHVEISLSIAVFVIFESVELLWEWAYRLREKGKIMHEERELAFMCIEELSSYADEVSEVDELFCKLVCTHWLSFSCELSFCLTSDTDTAVLS